MSKLKSNLRHSVLNMLTAPNMLRNVNTASKEQVNLLNKDGHVSLGTIYTAEECARLRAAITKAIDNKQTSFNEHSNYHVINSPLNLDPCIEKAMAEPILDIIRGYFKREIFLSDVDCRRVYPANKADIQKQGFSTSDWHKDIRGRQLKIMVYLTDVDTIDSTFSFVSGTHGRRTFTYDESRHTDAEVTKLGNVIDWVGKEGEATMFDTNIVHRLTRRPEARVRDTLTLYFTPGQSLRKIELNSSDPTITAISTGSPYFSNRT